MRFISSALLLLLPAAALSQTPEIDRAVKEKLATLKFIHSLQDPESGGFKVTTDGKASLRACSGAVKAVKSLGGKVPNEEKVKAFVHSCYDPATGAFAEPGAKPDVAITSIGVMAACELGIPKEKVAKAMDYLEKNAKSFEEVRIGAAAVEAWGSKPDWVKEWFKIANDDINTKPLGSAQDGGAREVGSHLAMRLRLGEPVTAPLQPQLGLEYLLAGQRDDGGWGKPAMKSSDIETTYRVMRAVYLLKAKPNDLANLRGFIAKHRNGDGGYATKPGEPSTMSGVYYCTIISKWLNDMESKAK